MVVSMVSSFVSISSQAAGSSYVWLCLVRALVVVVAVPLIYSGTGKLG